MSYFGMALRISRELWNALPAPLVCSIAAIPNTMSLADAALKLSRIVEDGRVYFVRSEQGWLATALKDALEPPPMLIDDTTTSPILDRVNDMGRMVEVRRTDTPQ